MEPALLRVEEAAKFLSIGRTKMYGLITKGVIPTVHIGSSVRITTESLNEFVQRLSRESADALHPSGA
jgi:excisionase family DNA binding protein